MIYLGAECQTPQKSKEKKNNNNKKEATKTMSYTIEYMVNINCILCVFLRGRVDLGEMGRECDQRAWHKITELLI